MPVGSGKYPLAQCWPGTSTEGREPPLENATAGLATCALGWPSHLCGVWLALWKPVPTLALESQRAPLPQRVLALLFHRGTFSWIQEAKRLRLSWGRLAPDPARRWHPLNWKSGAPRFISSCFLSGRVKGCVVFFLAVPFQLLGLFLAAAISCSCSAKSPILTPGRA